MSYSSTIPFKIFLAFSLLLALSACTSVMKEVSFDDSGVGLEPSVDTSSLGAPPQNL